MQGKVSLKINVILLDRKMWMQFDMCLTSYTAINLKLKFKYRTKTIMFYNIKYIKLYGYWSEMDYIRLWISFLMYKGITAP